MIQDLQADSTNLEAYINLRSKKHKMMNSLIILLTSDKYKESGNEMYYYARQIFNGNLFVRTDGTILQLKNAGNLRLIRKKNVVAALLEYEQKVKELQEWDETDTRTRTAFRDIGGTIFRSGPFYKTMDTTMNFVRPTDNPQLLTDKAALLNNVTFQIQYLATITLGNYRRATALKSSSGSLIGLLQKEYYLE